MAVAHPSRYGGYVGLHTSRLWQVILVWILAMDLLITMLLRLRYALVCKIS